MKPYAVPNFKNDLGEIAQARLLTPRSGGVRTVEITGSEAVITPEPDTVYRCGEMASLTVSSFPENGEFWIWFTSGAAPTTTIGIANFAAESSKIYRIFVENGYAACDSWPTG